MFYTRSFKYDFFCSLKYLLFLYFTSFNYDESKFVRFYLHVCSFIRREVQYIQDINPRDFHFRKENLQ